MTMIEKVQKAISLVITRGYQLDKEAFKLLQDFSRTRDPIKLIKETINKIDRLPEKPLFIGQDFLEEVMKEIFDVQKHQK